MSPPETLPIEEVEQHAQEQLHFQELQARWGEELLEAESPPALVDSSDNIESEDESESVPIESDGRGVVAGFPTVNREIPFGFFPTHTPINRPLVVGNVGHRRFVGDAPEELQTGAPHSRHGVLLLRHLVEYAAHARRRHLQDEAFFYGDMGFYGAPLQGMQELLPQIEGRIRMNELLNERYQQPFPIEWDLRTTAFLIRFGAELCGRPAEEESENTVH